jgi:UDP-N-acetylmuramoyl-tripeptide--D-alanyl-D-alanine ligase
MTSQDTLYSVFLKHNAVSTDTRNICPGCIFFALKGEKFDGNLFAAEALEKGASLAVVDNPSVASDHRYLLVQNVLSSLQSLAVMHRNTLKTIIIGITGTNGKTTTKELIRLVLSTTFKTAATSGNLNNQIGVPLTLLSLKADTEFAVVEMGANHPGEIETLCRITKPDYGLITNIGKAHLEGFGNLRAIIRTKSELYVHLRNSGGTAFINVDHPLLVRQAGTMKQFTYGRKTTANIRGRVLSRNPVLAMSWKHQDEWLRLQTSLYGDYNFENILAAVCIGEYFKIPPPRIIRAVSSYVPDNNRSQVIITKKGNTLILDAYNANPTSMNSAIRSFLTLPGTSKVLIIGDMLELGSNSHKEHTKIITLIKELDFTDVILVGEIFSSLPCPGHWLRFGEVLPAKNWLMKHKYAHCTILLKGSRKIKLETLAEIF